jgi:pimeloyl-ACP methyl ester carboxylesterase
MKTMTSDVRLNAQTNPASNARFLAKPGMKALGTTLRVLDRMWPALAIQAGWHILSTPPRFKTPLHEQAWAQTARQRSVSIEGRRLALYEWGPATAPQVLLVHSWGGRATQMGPLVPALLDRGLRVTAFDAPAHGRSSGRRTDMIEFPRVQAALAHTLGPLHAIVGHSFGAGMTQLAHRHHGLQASRVVMIASFTDCAWVIDRFGELFGLSDAVIEGGRRKFEQHHTGLHDWSQLSVVDALNANTVPTLLVHDENDHEIPYVHGQRLAQQAAHARLFTTQGLGHRRILRNAEVLRAVAEFVDPHVRP